MPKKKKNTKQNSKKPVNKKRLLVYACITLALIVSILIGLWVYARHYNQKDHVAALNEEELYQYNYLLTAFGRNANLTSDKQVLVLESITKNLGGNTETTFVIYTYSSASDLEAALAMTADEIKGNPNYEYMGVGSVTLVNDTFAGMQNMKVSYIK